MTALLTGTMSLWLAVVAGPAAVMVLSPSPGVSAWLVAPALQPQPFSGSLGPGKIVWVAAECEELGEAEAERLAAGAAAGATVVVEDAPRLATGALAAGLGMTLAAAAHQEWQAARPRHAGHPATVGIPFATWRLPTPAAGVPQVTDADVVVESAAGWPVAWVRRLGKGKVIGLAGQRHEQASPAQAIGYDALLTLLLLSAGGAGSGQLAEVAARAAFRAWMYLGFPVGQALYRLGAEVPAEYDQARAAALRAWQLAHRRPAEALALSGQVAASCERLAAWADAFWGGVALEAVRKAAARRELILCPGTLDLLHAMNLSTGPSGWGTGRPASGGQLWAAALADNPPGPASSYWRGLRPLLNLPAELPVGVHPDLQQRRLGGALAGLPCWLNPEVQRLLRESVPPVRGGTWVFYSAGQPWQTACAAPDSDYSPAALESFAKLAAAAGQQGPQAPESWEPSVRWLLWQRARAQQGQARWRTLAEAIHQHAPEALLAVDGGYLGEPARVGLAPETGSEYVDCLAPVILANYGVGFDLADLVAEVRFLVGLTDADGDGNADRWPGVVARLRWADALALPPAAHELVAAVALACGCQGIMQTWAQAAAWPDAAAAVPEEVYVRWEASFAPAVRGHELWLGARPMCEAVVWRSWTSAAMARPTSRGEQLAATRARLWAGLLARAGYLPRYWSDQALLESAWGSTAVVAVPSVLCAAPEACERLRGFAEQGGVVLLGPGSLVFDKYHGRAKLPAWLSGLRPASSDEKAAAVELRAAAVGARSREGQGLVLPAGGLVSAAYGRAQGEELIVRGDGAPVVWSWQVGKGWVVYFAEEPAADAAWASWLGQLLRRYGAEPAVLCGPGARGLMLAAGLGRRLVMVYNAGPVGEQRAVDKVEVAVAAGGEPCVVRELQPAGPLRRAGLQPVSVQTLRSGQRVSFTTTLAPHQYRLYLLSAS
jgi:hypothetical protein